MAEKKNGISILQVITLVIAVVGVAIGLGEYWVTNGQQYKKEIWSAQKDVFEKAIDAASGVANGQSLESVSQPVQEFWTLYWGKLSMLESQRVERAMIAFGDILRACQNGTKKDCYSPVPIEHGTELQRAALDLAHCARDVLRTTWEPVDLGTLTAPCPYSGT